jgi:hypothetical protein
MLNEGDEEGRLRAVPGLLPFALFFLLLAYAPSSPLAQPTERELRVLYIGNSLTYWHDLPRTIADLAKSVDESPLVYRVIAKPDYALEDHWSKGNARIIAEGGWNLVIMQQGPSSLLKNQQNLRYWTARFDSLIQAAGARSALYQVWPARRHKTSFTAVRESYRAAAIDVNGMFIPAGEAWRAAWTVDPTLDFYGSDGFHPSRLGTYLVALVHFELIYNRPAADLPDIAIVDGRQLKIPEATVALLQQAAHKTALTWGIR